MHTSTYTDVMDEFVEKVQKNENGLSYTFGHEQAPVKTININLEYKENEEIKSKEFKIYRTHHGPITQSINGNWVATAMMWDPINALIQSYTRTKQSGHKEFRKMMDIRTNSSNNTVYADAQGNIAYYHGNFIPKRDIKYDYTKPVDGSDPATNWQGLHTVDESIVVVNPVNGWIQNCNSTPFTSAGKYSPKVKDYPGYMSINRETFRGVHAVKVLKNANNLTLDSLINLAYDPFLPAFEVLIPGLIAAYDQSSTPDKAIKEAIEVLRKWDFSVSKESVAMSLAQYYGNEYRQKGQSPNGLSFMEKFAYYGSKSPKKERLAIFKEAIAKLTADFGQWNTPWGEINRYQRIDGQIRQPFNDGKSSLPVGLASGRWGALASYGARSYNNTKRIYGTSGNSFVAVVEFGDKVKAKTLLAGGQSGNPDSPHFADQAQRYIDVQFKDVAYYREDVEKRAKISYHPGELVKK